MRYLLAAQSVTGRIRKNNEDNFSIDTTCLDCVHGDSPMEERLWERGFHLMGVYDGMGGYSGGETASWLTARAAALASGHGALSDDPEGKLRKLCLEANDLVCREAEGSQMGTTCAMLFLEGDRFTLCNVGDSPIFLLREGTLTQLSVDHNQRATYEMVTGKTARPDQKFRLTQCIGIPKEEMLIEPCIRSGIVQPGDLFLLCSDGITDMVPFGEIREILQKKPDPKAALEALISQAMAAGGRDNATALCLTAKASQPGSGNLFRRFFRRRAD